MYASPDETFAALESVGYFKDQKTATTVYLAGKLHRPILLEGPAGAGKTELATYVSRAYKAPILRLQCYQGINEEKAIGQYDKSLQELYVLLMSKSDHTPDWTEIKREVTSRAYFMVAHCSKRSNRISSIEFPGGENVAIDVVAADMSLQAVKGTVTGKQVGRSMLVRSLAGIGETAAMIVGAPSANGAVSENDLLRMRVADNIGNAGDEQIMRMMTMQHIVVSVPAGTEIYVIFEKSQQGECGRRREDGSRPSSRKHRARFEHPGTTVEN